MLTGKRNKGRTPLHLALFLFLLVSTGGATAETAERWHQLETKRTVIQYGSLADLKKFNRKVAFTTGEWRLKSLFRTSKPADLTDAVRKKVDMLYERVQHILEMFGKLKEKVTINVYPDKRELHRAYLDITGRQCRARAWYIYERNAVYVNVEDLNEGMLAHELAHAIIDHYLIVRPPQATAEILARYVDDHLSY